MWEHREEQEARRVGSRFLLATCNTSTCTRMHMHITCCRRPDVHVNMYMYMLSSARCVFVVYGIAQRTSWMAERVASDAAAASKSPHRLRGQPSPPVGRQLTCDHKHRQAMLCSLTLLWWHGFSRSLVLAAQAGIRDDGCVCGHWPSVVDLGLQ